MIRHTTLLALSGLVLAGCLNRELPTMSQFSEPELTVTQAPAPPGATPGSCWGQDATPATIETVTEQILIQPAQINSDGTVVSPAVYKTETHQKIVTEREEIWFETPCRPEWTPEFIASLQRALKARGVYRGPITGHMDSRTRKAIRKFQKPQGLDSQILSVAAARKLGLIAIDQPMLAGSTG